MTTNTKHQGTLRFFTYFDVAQDTYVGVCFELGIVKEDSDPKALRQELLESAVGYVEAVGKNALPEDLLNQNVPQEYENIYRGFLSSLTANQHTHAMPSGIQHPNVFAERVPA
ncbi:MAG TPA: hypothetical protein VJI96_03395 [Candidatus Andersenbacteria bacterium]|nr:hypothetical protein [Candidatus Andersenbacteria bacterium]